MLRRRALLLLLTALCVVPATVAMLAGGYTAEHPLRLSTPAPSPGEPAGVQDNSSRALEVALDVRAEAEKQVGRTFSVWEPVAVRTQVVAGTNYQFKVRVALPAWRCRRRREVVCVCLTLGFVPVCALLAQVRVSPTEYAFVKVFQPLPYTGKPPEARSAGCSTARSSRSLFDCPWDAKHHPLQVTAITTGHTDSQALDV